MVKVEIGLGNCDCMYYSHKYLILRVLKEAIENQKDVINKVESKREEIIKEGMNPDQMIGTSKKFIKSIERTEKVLKDITLCK